MFQKEVFILIKRLFTLYFWFLGFNDPYIAEDRVLSKYSYLRKLRNNKEWILIDCGSYKGKFAESLSKHLVLSQIIFVDINKEFNTKLKEKFPKAKIINRAISIKKGYLYLVRNNRNSGENIVSSTIKTKEKVKTITLSEVFNSKIKNPNKCIFLKIDIEGNEINILKTLPKNVLNEISVISIEILPGKETINSIRQLNEFIPHTYEFFRERRYGLIGIKRDNPHWTDNLNLFQNLILINSQVKFCVND
jgi:FkbM family methyltransferase